jgi:hypothetical protein
MAREDIPATGSLSGFDGVLLGFNDFFRAASRLTTRYMIGYFPIY